MCTLSWLTTSDGIRIFFNRDEAKTRPKALLPSVQIAKAGHKYIMPIDSQSNGSWMGVTEHGFSVCLLNFYQGKTPKGELISRGLLVRDLLELPKTEPIEQYLNKQKWHQYAPFTLVLFLPSHKSPLTYCWDGENFSTVEIHSPYTSSGVDFPEVSAARQATFSHYFSFQGEEAEIRKVKKLREFHTSHQPIKSKLSVCMHREDASTVSFSEIKVTTQTVHFDYIDGAPCEGKRTPILLLERS
ncbi:hypothetical protein CBF23_013980 [Marinomonas agarivorans]|nr:hypothetical protein CBF23_013980 [Marinomonas agarivorans]